MITRQSWTTLVLGALAGAGLGAGALTLVKRSTSGCCGGAGSCDPKQPTADGGTIADAGSMAALTTLATNGPADGRWNYRDSRRSVDQVISRDPSDAGVIHMRPVNDRAAATSTLPLDVMARALFGNLQRFLANYRPCDGAATESLDGQEFLRVR